MKGEGFKAWMIGRALVQKGGVHRQSNVSSKLQSSLLSRRLCTPYWRKSPNSSPNRTAWWSCTASASGASSPAYLRWPQQPKPLMLIPHPCIPDLETRNPRASTLKPKPYYHALEPDNPDFEDLKN